MALECDGQRTFGMIGSWRAIWRQTLAVTLAAGLLAFGRPSSATEGIAPENSLRTAWSPSREDAVVVEGLPAVFESHATGGESLVPRSRATQRPRSLSRPAPSRMSAY